MSLNIVRNGSLSAVPSLPAGAHVGEVLNVVNLGAATNALVDSSTLQLRGGAASLATNDSLKLVWTGSKWVELERSVALAEKHIVATVGDWAAGEIEVGIAIQDAQGNVVVPATPVIVRTLATTADKGDITVDVGTAIKSIDPATGEKYVSILADDEATETDAIVVTIADDVEELVSVVIQADGCLPVTLALDFTDPAP